MIVDSNKKSNELSEFAELCGQRLSCPKKPFVRGNVDTTKNVHDCVPVENDF